MSTINNTRELTRREFFEQYVIKDSEELVDTKLNRVLEGGLLKLIYQVGLLIFKQST